jgi:hypothetical protein
MVGELVRRAHAVEKHGGVAASTHHVSFGGRVLTWADVPPQTRRAVRHSAAVVTEQVGVDSQLYDEGSAVVQVLRAWRAHTDRLYCVVASRPVVVADVPRPAGAWQPRELRRFDAVGQPARRIGWVPAGVAPVGGGPAGAGPSLVPVAVGPDKRSAADAWTHLPQPVREGAERAVPLPDDWLGGLVQHTRPDGFATSQEISVLRRDAARAVVLRATRALEPGPGATRRSHDRALATTDWLVEQVTYDLSQPAVLEARIRRNSRLWT